MDDTVYGDLANSLDNMTQIETPRSIAVRHCHPRLRHMFREAISYCREKFKVTPPIEIDMFDFNHWAESYGLKNSTILLLCGEDLNTRDSLCCLTPELIDALDITIGQKLLLKNAVKHLKDEPNPGNPVEKTESSLKPTECSKSKHSGQLTLTPDGQLGPELLVDAEPMHTELVEVDVGEIEEKSKIYFNLKPGQKMYDYHSAVNKASKEICMQNPALLADRKLLFDKARARCHEKGYIYKKKKSRSQLYVPEESIKEKKRRLSGDIRNKRIAELGEDLSEIDIEMRLQFQQREKYKNVNELNRAIDSTNKLTDLRAKRRQLQEELTVLQMKDAQVKKSKKSKENRKAFDLMGFQKASSFSIDSFFKPSSQIQDTSIVSGDPNTSTDSQNTIEPGAQNISTESQNTIEPGAQSISTESQDTIEPGAQNISTESQDTIEPGSQNRSTESQNTPESEALNINTVSQNTSTESQKSNTENDFL